MNLRISREGIYGYFDLSQRWYFEGKYWPCLRILPSPAGNPCLVSEIEQPNWDNLNAGCFAHGSCMWGRLLDLGWRRKTSFFPPKKHSSKCNILEWGYKPQCLWARVPIKERRTSCSLDRFLFDGFLLPATTNVLASKHSVGYLCGAATAERGFPSSQLISTNPWAGKLLSL
jgi:hypothetical protein